MAQNGVYTYPPPYAAPESSSGAKISPTVLIIIVVLAFLFFISGVLHLLVKFLAKHRSPLTAFQEENNEISESDALQRQLQQLFHLHDCGLDQAVIDALPVFIYKDIMGPKEPYDCAVCLCEFNEEDNLRLLPMCSHAFHTGCIDTWLLSSSTCPICRNSLFASGFSVENPIFEFGEFGEDEGYSCSGRKTVDVEQQVVADDRGEEQLPVRLGKFRKLDGQVSAQETECGETSSSNFDGRRCYSMGSYQYIVGETDLRVALSQDRRFRHVSFSTNNDQDTVDSSSSFEDTEAKKICNAARGESLSVSKIWMWPKANRFSNSSDIEMGLSLPSSLDTGARWMFRR
ncbi:hypothetical protein QQ045_028011 [Rhodiola kirilowii]